VDTNKSDSVTFRLSTKERHALNIMASRENMDPSEFLRSILRKEAERKGIYPLAFVDILPIENVGDTK
jgi:hypothetical protein